MTAGEKQNRKILIVDDEPSVVAYLEALLKDHGYKTLAAADGAEGLEIARREKPDLVTLDINMPKTSGIRMYRELKEDPALASIPVLVLTAVTGYGGDPDEFRKFISSRKHIPPPEGFVAKPIEQVSFLELVGKLSG